MPASHPWTTNASFGTPEAPAIRRGVLNSAVLLLSDAPTEMELDRHLLRLAGQYPGIPDVTKAQQALRRKSTRFVDGIGISPKRLSE